MPFDPHVHDKRETGIVPDRMTYVLGVKPRGSENVFFRRSIRVDAEGQELVSAEAVQQAVG
jgi:hypothetical protein